MKYLISLVIFTCLSLQFGFSQVKKSYVDSDHSETTVVVKEDSASDIDILNSQFDINAIGLGEVIMIKTEKEPKEAQPKVAEKPAPKVVVKEATKPAREVAALPQARKEVSEKYFKGTGRSKKIKKKRKKRRFKNRKFKKRKSRTGCPTF